MIDDGSPRKLTKLTVDGLLGRFDHVIPFPDDWRFLILHGPNGVGKTRLLELVYSSFTKGHRDLARIPFSSVRFEFSDNSWIEIKREQQPKRRRSRTSRRDFPEDENILVWEIALPGRKTISHEMRPEAPTISRRIAARLETQYPIEQMDVDLWIDYSSGEELTAHEVAERYRVPTYPEGGADRIPEELDLFLKSQEVHLIETQRLLATHQSAPKARRRRIGNMEQRATVESYAEHLSERFDATLAANSRTSQTLDRSFPSRLFQEVDATDTEEQLRQRYAEQLELRSRLASIAILDSSADLELPDRALKDWERRVLRTYLDDAEAKLLTFQPVLDRLELLKAIVNERFLFKRLDFDRERGFAFTDEDSEVQVNLRHLSSGEQHEVVLLYDLLMNVNENALVLIDEPEISLHVSWQKAFLNDLDRIASLTELRFIIATHSPQIIGNWWDHTIELYKS